MHQHTNRSGIAHDVVHRKCEKPSRRRGPDQRAAQQRPTREIERLCAGGKRELARPRVRRREGAGVFLIQKECGTRRDTLTRLATDDDECRSERFVALDQSREGLAKGGQV